MLTPPKQIRHIVLTRPAGENQVLWRQLAPLPAVQDKQLWQAPLLSFSAVVDPGLSTQLGTLEHNDWLIFVSPRAVSFAFAQHPQLRQSPARFACVGKATAKALQAQGVTHVVAPQTRFDSEGLLALLTRQQVQDRRVLIIRGTSGRTLLAETLREWGAQVDFCPVYRCHCASLPSGLSACCDQGMLFVLTAPVALECLVQQANQQSLLESSLVLINQRAADKARRLGFTGAISLADSPQPPALAAAVSRLLVKAG